MATMKNVLDIKKERNLNFILSLDAPNENVRQCLRNHGVIVVIHLFYEDSVETYIKYIKNIPAYVDILFTVSSVTVKEKLEEIVKSIENKCKIVEKKNRGRDISSLLVVAREEILKYEYVCFLHDKKEKNILLKEDTRKWVTSLWESMLASEGYVENILNLFEKNPSLGVLAPPFYIGEYQVTAYTNAWCDNYMNTIVLAEKLGVDCNLSEDKKPITLGTVFWAKTKALKKLFDFEWCYEDFDEEPLRPDGTLSHAIERCIAYVAQDGGYETGMVMTEQFATQRLEYADEVLDLLWGLVQEELGIINVNLLRNYDRLKEQLLDFSRENKNIYIYGAGLNGKCCLRMLENLSISVQAFLVSEKKEGKNEFEGKAVISIHEVELTQKSGIIVAGTAKNREEICKKIKEVYPDFNNIYIYGDVKI